MTVERKSLNVTDAAKALADWPRQSLHDLATSGDLHPDCVQIAPGRPIRIRMDELAYHHTGMFTEEELRIWLDPKYWEEKIPSRPSRRSRPSPKMSSDSVK